MNELYYMGLDNCNYLTSNDINYPQYANYRQNKTMFTNPKDKRTEDYITGRFG